MGGALPIMSKDNEVEFLQKKLTTDITIAAAPTIPFVIAFGGNYLFDGIYHVVDELGVGYDETQLVVTVQELSREKYGNAFLESYSGNRTLQRLAKLVSSAPMVIKGIKLTVSGTGTLPGPINFTYFQSVYNSKILEIPAGKTSKSTVSPNQYNSNIVYYNIPELVILDGSSVLVMNMPANIPRTLSFRAEFAIETVARQIEISEIQKIEKQYKELNKCF